MFEFWLGYRSLFWGTACEVRRTRILTNPLTETYNLEYGQEIYLRKHNYLNMNHPTAHVFVILVFPSFRSLAIQVSEGLLVGFNDGKIFFYKYTCISI